MTCSGITTAQGSLILRAVRSRKSEPLKMLQKHESATTTWAKTISIYTIMAVQTLCHCWNDALHCRDCFSSVQLSTREVCLSAICSELMIYTVGMYVWVPSPLVRPFLPRHSCVKIGVSDSKHIQVTEWSSPTRQLFPTCPRALTLSPPQYFPDSQPEV
jgi:hypothetical protein